MNPGKLRHRLQIEKKVVARDSYGAETITWTDVDTVWGSVEPISGREYFLAQQVQSEVTHRVTIRYYAGMNPGWRIKFGTRIFDVLSVINTEERNREMILMTREFVT